jgi:hypothetical protein
MNAGDAINAAGKPGIIYLKSVIDGSPKSNGSGKMWEESLGGGPQRQDRYQDYLGRKQLRK